MLNRSESESSEPKTLGKAEFGPKTWPNDAKWCPMLSTISTQVWAEQLTSPSPMYSTRSLAELEQQCNSFHIALQSCFLSHKKENRQRYISSFPRNCNASTHPILELHPSRVSPSELPFSNFGSKAHQTLSWFVFWSPPEDSQYLHAGGGHAGLPECGFQDAKKMEDWWTHQNDV